MGAIDDEQLEQILAFQRHDGGVLGEIVIGRGLLSPLALAAALAQQREAGGDRRASKSRPAGWKPLGRILVERRRITEVHLRQALADQRRYGGFLGEILIRRGWITPAELVGALSAQLAQGPENDNCFYVREQVRDEVRMLHAAPTFLAATDYVFEEVLVHREPEALEIVRGTGSGEEVVWQFTPVRKNASSAADLLNVFRALTAEWAASGT